MPSRDNLIYEGCIQIFCKNNTYTILYTRNLIWYLGEEGTPGTNPAPDTEGGTQATVIFHLLPKLVGWFYNDLFMYTVLDHFIQTQVCWYLWSSILVFSHHGFLLLLAQMLKHFVISPLTPPPILPLSGECESHLEISYEGTQREEVREKQTETEWHFPFEVC